MSSPTPPRPQTLKARARLILLGVGTLAVLALVFFLRRSGGSEGAEAAERNTGAAASTAGQSQGGLKAGAPAGSPQDKGRAPSTPATGPRKPENLAELGWGSGPSQLGRERLQEGNPEAPMSMTVDPFGNVMVLDQVNGRLLRMDSEGKVQGTFPLTQQTPQDIAVARDGTLVVLDRLRDKTVAILDPATGALRGELPVEGKGIDEPGLVTGTFVDGDSVYVEREHGALIRIGDTSGRADAERPEIPGRPTRDGRSYLLAGIIDRREGRVFVNAVDRQSGQHRYTREFRLRFPLLTIALLDSDLSGVIYLGVTGELPTGKAEPASQLGLRVFCLEQLDGKVLGQTDLPINAMPEETFRDLAVLDEGGVLYRHITEAGVTLMRASCR
ncbi:hypothetical protein [Hyalangium rubrum]|uniref:Lipoprotein n=1 Tax=Hyalangium rubrum TaxID=3103134 RepID=A0ABU5GWV1_9BACT|nr:hypothetical protein [Hyalangium sp. s54d21]MDY7225566.1 hypothetical protein [Hyalangium sp. s54d21]